MTQNQDTVPFYQKQMASNLKNRAAQVVALIAILIRKTHRFFNALLTLFPHPLQYCRTKKIEDALT
jgi:hypothetical protein